MDIVVLGDYGDVSEKVSSWDHFFGALPESVHFVTVGVEGEGHEVELALRIPYEGRDCVDQSLQFHCGRSSVSGQYVRWLYAGNSAQSD